MTTTARLLAPLSMALALSACATGASNGFRASGQPIGVRVTISNRDFSDATIYLHWNGFKTRAGIVTGKDEQTFTVDWRSDRMQIEADFIGQGVLWSDVIDVYDGDHISWLIQPTW